MEPVIEIGVPGGPVEGLIAIVATTVNGTDEVAVPIGVMTLTGPVVVPTAIRAMIW